MNYAAPRKSIPLDQNGLTLLDVHRSRVLAPHCEYYSRHRNTTTARGALVAVHSLLTTLNPIEGNLLLQLPADANGSQVDIVPSDRTDLVVFAPAHSRVLLSVNDIPFQSFEMPQAGVARVILGIVSLASDLVPAPPARPLVNRLT